MDLNIYSFPALGRMIMLVLFAVLYRVDTFTRNSVILKVISVIEPSTLWNNEGEFVLFQIILFLVKTVK